MNDYDMKLRRFLKESLQIEGIYRGPRAAEFTAAKVFLDLPRLTIEDVLALQAVIAPGMALRDQHGMNVRVGSYLCPPGGPAIRKELINILETVNYSKSPWKAHVDFEMLHPFMDGNGRTGRLIWAWDYQRFSDAFSLPFLHRFYYQTLEAQR